MLGITKHRVYWEREKLRRRFGAKNEHFIQHATTEGFIYPPHAHNCTACLQLNGKLDIEIKDNGVGLPTKRHAGVGLNSIHERAAELGGLCIIQSEPGAGTKIFVSLCRE